MVAISVCIPAYNYGRYLRQAIDSVLAQTWRDFELIVVDNCSSDDTADIVRAVSREYPALRHERNAEVLSMAANFNRALRLARGRWVKMLCADDWLAPDALRASAEAMVRYPGAAMVATGRVLVSEAGDPAILARFSGTEGAVDAIEVINRCLFGTNDIGEPSAVLFRRDIANRGFDERYRHSIDLEMWFHLLEQGALVSVPAPLAMIRRHATQATRDNVLAGHIIEDKKRLYADYGRRPYVIRTPWKDFRWRLRTAYNAWGGGRGSGDAAALRPTEFVNPIVFFALLPAMVLFERMRDAFGRWRARRDGHGASHRCKE